MKQTLILAAIATVTLASCSNCDQPSVEANHPISFKASIVGVSTSRAFDQTWESGDKIGISCTTGGKSYDNVAYTTDGTGDFTAVATGTEIYYQSADPVTFTAYHPHSEDATAITADTHNQASQKGFDYLWTQATGSKASPHVSLAFNHKMAKLVLTIKKGLDVSFDEVKEAMLTLGGFKNVGSFDASAGEATASGEACGAWTFAGDSEEATHNAPVVYDEENQTAVYTLILFPQEHAAVLPLTATTALQTFSTALDFTAANTAIGDGEAKNEWVAGRQYNVSVTLHKTALALDGCYISAWDVADGGNFDAQ